MRRGAYQEFKNGEAVAGVQASSGSGGYRDPAMVDAAHVGGRPLVPSMSGGFSFQKASDVQEVPSWSISRPHHSDQSSEDDQGGAPASQSNSPSNPLRMLHHSNVNFYKGDARKEELFLHETMDDHTLNRSGVTSKTSVQDYPYEDTGQPPPEPVRNIMLRQDASFREQVQELHRVYKLQMLLMEEMKKKDANSSSAISGQCNMNGRSSWTSLQAAAQEKGSEVTGSTQERGFELEHVEKELKQNSQSSQGGGKKPFKRRTFDLERPPEENMDDEEEEELATEGTGMMEVEKGGLGLSHGWVEPVTKQPQQEHVHGASPRSENSVRGAPFRPTPTMNTQSFLGGLWGLSLDRKTEEKCEDRQLRECSHLKGRRPLQLEIDEKPLPHFASRITQKVNFSASPWEWQSNGSASVQPRLQLQQSQNEDVRSGQQQQAQPRPWTNASEGAFRASPVMAMRPPPQGHGPHSISEDGTPVFPASTEGETTHLGLAPAVYNQGYPLTATAVPALGMQLRPYEGPVSIPGQGLVVPAMNAAWYSHTAPTFPMQQPLLQTGWQQVSTYHPAPGAIYAVPAAAAGPPLAFNVDGFHRLHEDPSSASWGTSNNGPPFSPFSIIPPPKPPFKRPPKLVLRQDGTTMELKLVSPQKDQSPSSSSDDEVCGLSKERDDSQGEDMTVMKEREGPGYGAFKGIVGGGPHAGGKRELKEIIGSDQEREVPDQEREVPLRLRIEKYNRSDTRNSVAEGPMQGSLDRFRDERDYSDESGSGCGETGVGNVINPGEREGHNLPASESQRLLPAGEGEEGMNTGNLGMQHRHKVVDRWGQKIFFATEDVKTSAEGKKNHYHLKAEAFEEQHAFSPPKPGQISARDIYPFPYSASLSKCSIGGHGSEEEALPKVKQASCPRGPQEQASNAVEVKDKTSKSLEEFEQPKQDYFVKEADASTAAPSQDKDMLTISGLTSTSSLCEAVGVEVASLQGDTGKELQQAVVKQVSEVPLNNEMPAGESVGGEANTDKK